MSKEANFSIVDLRGLYKKIMKGNFKTDDGVHVNPNFTDGNFFSSDGIYSTPFGNAIIANEYIITLNNFYKLSIPLIPTREYLDLK